MDLWEPKYWSNLDIELWEVVMKTVGYSSDENGRG